METLIRTLHQGGYSCVIANGTDVRSFTQRGVADLYDLLRDDPSFLRGASIADKVVGKGAAALMVLGGIRELYTDVISEPALELLRRSGIETTFAESVPGIRNRDQSGWCPLETICLEKDTAQDILPLIDSFIAKMRDVASGRK